MRFSEFIWSAADVITTDRYKEHVDKIPPEAAYYMKTDLFYCGKSMLWRHKIHVWRDSKVWVTGHSDYEISDAIVQASEGRFTTWFTVNMACSHPRVFSLPLGITNCTHESWLHPIFGDIPMMVSVKAEPSIVRKMVYMNFNTTTHACRPLIHKKFSKESWVTVGLPTNTMEGRRDFLRNLKSHKFSICPRGGGIDTHRLWESLYMGCIPIVQREGGIEQYNLPILVVDDWSELTLPFLEGGYKEYHERDWNMDMLRISYWLAKIDNATCC